MLCSLVLLGCTEPEVPREPALLADHAQWAPGLPEDDPFDHRPEDEAIDCPASSWSVQLDESIASVTLEIDTGLCNYLGLTQPSAVEVEPGDELQIAWGHGRLRADTDAQAHLAILLGDLVLWDSVEPIPSRIDQQWHTLQAPEAVPAGTPLWVHLHNHGANTWVIGDLERVPR